MVPSASGALSLGLSTAGSFLSLKSRLECHLLWEDPLATQPEHTHHHLSLCVTSYVLSICHCWNTSAPNLLALLCCLTLGGGSLSRAGILTQSTLNTSPSVTHSAVTLFYRGGNQGPRIELLSSTPSAGREQGPDSSTGVSPKGLLSPSAILPPWSSHPSSSIKACSLTYVPWDASEEQRPSGSPESTQTLAFSFKSRTVVR